MNNILHYFVASMARKIYLRGGLGVGAFRRIYGGAKRNGSRPRHFCKSSGSIARHILQQLQNVNIIDLDTKGWVFLCIILGFINSLLLLALVHWWYQANWLSMLLILQTEAILAGIIHVFASLFNRKKKYI